MKKRVSQNTPCLVAGSIFSGGGLGDVGVEWGAGIPVLAACEIVPSRAALLRANFPGTKVLEGDIWDLHEAYVAFFRKQLGGKPPWLITLSPPCQGMSSNGAGRISSSIRSGLRPQEDERNRLILPGIKVLEKLTPDWFILENVRRMENTVIRNENGKPENILHGLGRRLHPLGYTLRSSILDFRDYGVPHHRERLITIGCRIRSLTAKHAPVRNIYAKEASVFHPVPTHGGVGQLPQVSLRQAIGHLSTLDAQTRLFDRSDPYHCVPKWNQRQYDWMKATPEGQTAFDNFKCLDCGKRMKDPDQVTCSCGSPLPRPQIGYGSDARLVRGFRSSYRRMRWDQPGSTLTMNSGVISSDLKGHPDQHRVLSLREIMILATLDRPDWPKTYDFEGVRYGRMGQEETFSKKLIREVVGESIPPLAMKRIVERLMELDDRL